MAGIRHILSQDQPGRYTVQLPFQLIENRKEGNNKFESLLFKDENKIKKIKSCTNDGKNGNRS